MMYVEFMKNFLLADSSKHMAVGLISASSEQKRFNPLFRHDDIMYVEFMKNFLFPIQSINQSINHSLFKHGKIFSIYIQH